MSEDDTYENPYVAEPHEVLIESKHVVIGEPLGEGAFGRVFRGEWKNKNTGAVVSPHGPTMFSGWSGGHLCTCFHSRGQVTLNPAPK